MKLRSAIIGGVLLILLIIVGNSVLNSLNTVTDAIVSEGASNAE